VRYLLAANRAAGGMERGLEMRVMEIPMLLTGQAVGLSQELAREIGVVSCDTCRSRIRWPGAASEMQK
jgi:hypothetical protein